VAAEAVSLLEDVDVEDIMDARPVRQVNTIGDIAHTFQHLEWPGVARAQLAPRPGDQGLSWPVKEPKPHREVEAKQFAHPLMLGNSREALVEHVLERVVVGPDDEVMTP
jgi:hypothetical protein